MKNTLKVFVGVLSLLAINLNRVAAQLTHTSDQTSMEIPTAILMALSIVSLTLIALVKLVKPEDRKTVAIKAIEGLTSIMRVLNLRFSPSQKRKKLGKK